MYLGANTHQSINYKSPNSINKHKLCPNLQNSHNFSFPRDSGASRVKIKMHSRHAFTKAVDCALTCRYARHKDVGITNIYLICK